MNIITSKPTNGESIDDHIQDVVINNPTINEYITTIAATATQISGTAAAPGIPLNTDGTTGIFNDSGGVGISHAGTKRLRVDSTALTSSKKIRLDDAGTAALPAFSNTGDTTTGVYFPSAGNFAIATNGVQALNLSSTLATSALPLSISNTTDSTTTTTGALKVAGGFGCVKKATFGDTITTPGLKVQNIQFSVDGSSGFPSLYSTIDPTTGMFIDTVTPEIVFDVSGTDTLSIGSSITELSQGILTIDDPTPSTLSDLGCLLTNGGIGINCSTAASNATNGGSLTTAGGIAVAKNSYFGDTINGTKATFSDTTDSTASNVGSVVFEGGVGIDTGTDATDSNNGGALTVAGGLAVARNSFFGNTIHGTKVLLSDTTPSTSTTTGAFQVVGGIGCGGTGHFGDLSVHTNNYSVNRRQINSAIQLTTLNPTGKTVTFLNGLGTSFNANKTGMYLITVSRDDGDYTNALQPYGAWYALASNNGGGKGILISTIFSQQCTLTSWTAGASTTTATFSFTGDYTSSHAFIDANITLL